MQIVYIGKNRIYVVFLIHTVSSRGSVSSSEVTASLKKQHTVTLCTGQLQLPGILASPCQEIISFLQEGI